MGKTANPIPNIKTDGDGRRIGFCTICDLEKRGEILGVIDSDRTDAGSQQPLCSKMGGMKMRAFRFLSISCSVAGWVPLRFCFRVGSCL